MLEAELVNLLTELNYCHLNDPQRTYQIACDLNKSNKERQSIELMLSEQINSEVKNFQDDPCFSFSRKQLARRNNWYYCFKN